MLSLLSLIGAVTETPPIALSSWIIHSQRFSWPHGIETTFSSFPSRWLGPKVKFWPMGFKERYCAQLLRRILKGKCIFSFLLASWNAACDRKRMTAILDYLVSWDTTEQQDRRGLEPDSRTHHDCYRLAVFQKRKLPSPLSRGESAFSDIHYTNRKKHRTQTDIFPKKIYTNGHQVWNAN